MPTRLSVPNQRKTVTKGIVLCCGCVGLSFLAIVGFGLLQRIQAAENTLPDHQVSAVPTRFQAKLGPNYSKLRLSFEANQGQTDARVRFLARGDGYTIFLTENEAVLSFGKAAGVAPTFRSACAGLKPGPTASVDKPTTDHGPRTAFFA